MLARTGGAKTMKRTLVHSSIAALFAVAAVALLLAAIHYHSQYADAHVAADKAVRECPDRAKPPVSPEPFCDKAQWSTAGVFLIAIVSLILAIKARHPAWFVSLAICVIAAATAFAKTGIRY